MLSILISGRAGRDQFTHASGPLEFGRGPSGDLPRRQILDPKVSSNQLRIEELADLGLRLVNLSQRVAVQVADGSIIGPGSERVVKLPVRVHVGDTLIEVEFEDVDSGDAAGRDFYRTIEPPVGSSAIDRTIASPLGDAPDPAEMARWFEALVAVQSAAASSIDFFVEASRAIVNLIGLDLGLVLLRQDDRWMPVSSHPSTITSDTDFSRKILDIVARERRTFFQAVEPTSRSLVGVSAVVASPILGDDESVLGALYGVRRGKPSSASVSIRPLEAQLTQVLAAAVASGLARMKGEAEAVRQRVQFEQFFTADLASVLDADPGLLDGREREVTILFADIRNFSALSEGVTPGLTCELVRDVMEHLTTCVRAQEGVLVDYIGDGLLAMWNAPVAQDDHAVRACRAALAMRAEMPALNATWEARLGGKLGVGIGLNTGPALVGNVGSRIKFKYGPLGHTVNLASRVEGATKQLGVPIMMTGATRERIGETFATRRLCQARVVGIRGTVDLYELHAERGDPEWHSRRAAYERALSLYEAGEWGEACQALYPVLSEGRDSYDVPSLTLIGRAVECLKQPPAGFDAVIDLKSK
jgi:adenylate cyclase